MANPKCCGKESKLVIQSINLKYFFCDVCKDEVDEIVPRMGWQNIAGAAQYNPLIGGIGVLSNGQPAVPFSNCRIPPQLSQKEQHDFVPLRDSVNIGFMECVKCGLTVHGFSGSMPDCHPYPTGVVY